MRSDGAIGAQFPQCSTAGNETGRPASRTARISTARVCTGSVRSADRWRVLQAAFVPQVVDAARHAERSHVAIPLLAEVADLLDDVIGPLVVDPERLAHVAVDAEQALDVGVVGLQHVVDVLAGHPLLLGGDHREMGPLHDVVELVVALAHHCAERLLADDLGQQHEVVGLRSLREAERRQRGAVGRVGVAATRQERGLDLVDVLDQDRRELHLVQPEVVGDRELGAGARLHADGRAVELLGAFHARGLFHQEAGAVVPVHIGELEAEIAFAPERPGGLADQHVDLARLQRGEAVLRRRVDELHLRRVAQDRGVDAAHHPLAVGERKAGHGAGDPAGQLAAALDRVDSGRAGALRLGRPGKRERREHATCKGEEGSLHVISRSVAAGTARQSSRTVRNRGQEINPSAHRPDPGARPMSAPVLDHVVVDVHDDMDDAVRIYGRLGFTLTPRGHHTLGSINHLAMFEQNYLELLGFGDGARAELAAFPRGLNGLVFKTDDADATARDAAAAGLTVLPVAAFSRPVTLGGESRDARFRTARLDPAGTGLGRIYFCEHATPELVWRDEWLGHPNGAQTIVRLLIAAQRPDRLRDVFARLFGADAVRTGADGVTMQAGNVQIAVRTHAAVEAELGDAAPDAAGRTDYMAALTVRVAALDPAPRALTSVPGVSREAGCVVAPARACGNVALIFTT